MAIIRFTWSSVAIAGAAGALLCISGLLAYCKMATFALCNFLNSMRKSSLVVVVLGAIFVAFSCKSDFDVTADYKEIPIVYGILNPSDTVHYLRITKAFLGDGDALHYATIPDSSSYGANVEVVLHDSASGQSAKDIVFDTISIFNKEPGTFYAPGQLFYYSKEKIKEGDLCHLKIKNKLSGHETSSSATMLSGFSFTMPSSYSKTLEIRRNNQSSLQVKWNNAKNGRKYQMRIWFYYKEYHQANDTSLAHIVWEFSPVNATSIDGTSETTIKAVNEQFYQTCIRDIPYTDAASEAKVGKRFADHFVIEVAVGDDNFATYLDVNNFTGGLLTEKPVFSNITNGLGLFAGMGIYYRTIPVGAETKLDLYNVPDLKFQKPQ